MRKDVSTMCNLSQWVLEQGEARGMERGILLAIQNLMESMQLSAEQAMDALKVPPEKRGVYLEQMQK